MLISFFAQAILSLQSQISSSVPSIAWIDQDLGQLEHYDTRPAVQFPCVLIDFVETSYKEVGKLVKWGGTTVQLRIGFAPFSSANSAAPEASKEAALQYYEIEQALTAALHGWSLNYAGIDISDPLILVRAATEDRNDPYRIRVIQFTTAFEDDSASPVSQRVKANLQINME